MQVRFHRISILYMLKKYSNLSIFIFRVIQKAMKCQSERGVGRLLNVLYNVILTARGMLSKIFLKKCCLKCFQISVFKKYFPKNQ